MNIILFSSNSPSCSRGRAQPTHVLGQARLNNSEFATVALCATQHPKFRSYKIAQMLRDVSIEDLLKANEAGAKVGPDAWTLIKGALAEDCGENVLESSLHMIFF